MKNFLFLLLILLVFAKVDCFASIDFRFEIIKQRRVENVSNNIFATREVHFRLTNLSNRPIFIKGNNLKEFFPIGFLSNYDKKRKQWKSSFGTNKIPDLKDLGVYNLDSYKLMPNESFTFTDILEDSDIPIKYKKIIYISFGTEGSPNKPIESPIFILKED